MDGNNTTYEQTADAVRAGFHRNYLKQSLPSIIFMSVVGTLGIAGNLFSLHFYHKKARPSPSILLIKALAIADAAVCCLCFVVIIEIYYNILYTSTPACKASYFFHHMCVKFSIYLCISIAIDRYKLVCRPFDGHMTIKAAKLAIVISLVIAILLSAGDSYSFEIVSIPLGNYTPMIYGHRCAVSEEEDIKTYILVTHIFDAVGVFVIFCILIFIYGSIVRSLYIVERQIRGLSSSASQRKEKTTTLMMFAVSVMFLVFFTPYLIKDIMSIASGSHTKRETTLSRMAYTSVFLNSVVNPLIYCIFNSAFRRYLKKLVCKVPDDESSVSVIDRNTQMTRGTLSRNATLDRTGQI